MQRLPVLLASLIGLLLGGPAHGGDTFTDTVRPFLAKHCVACHGSKTQKGDRRFDTLQKSMANRKTLDRWRDVLNQLNRGSMPPRGRPRPDQKSVRTVVAWITAELTKAESRLAPSTPGIRRLNRREYDNTIRDLLGIDAGYGPSRNFPADGTAHGFDTSASALVASAPTVREALNAAREAIDRALHFGPQPKRRIIRLRPRDAARPTYRNDRYVMIATGTEDGFQRFYPNTKQFPDVVSGEYVIRVKATGMYRGYRGKGQVEGPIRMKIRIGSKQRGVGGRRQVGLFRLGENDPQTYTVRARMEPGEMPIVSFPNGHNGSLKNLVRQRFGKEARKGRAKLYPKWNAPHIRVFSVEVEGPIHDTWPPRSHALIVGSNAAPNREAAQAILKRFLPRAFRRPATAEDVKPYVALYDAQRRKGDSHIAALKLALAAVLCDPDFLYIRSENANDRLSGYGLASRLSYLLWSSMPDRALLNSARRGTLHKPDELMRQVRRMLASPKSAAFVHGFAGQWLGVNQLGTMPPDPKRFKTYYRGNLEDAMRQETHRFFAHVLQNNLGVANFIDSRFTFLNERLAKHYGVGGVTGDHFRKVELKPGGQRGGLLGQASMLTVTSNGTVTSPVVRGVWVLENLLGTPPSPPPPDIEPLEPDTRGATTIREQLAKHRKVAACANCHRKIDPLGFALERFDPIGSLRGRYDNKRRIDTAATLSDGSRITGPESLKRHLLKNKRKVVRCLVEKLLIYGTGRRLRVADHKEFERIVASSERNGDRLRDLIIAVVQSRIFLDRKPGSRRIRR